MRVKRATGYFARRKQYFRVRQLHNNNIERRPPFERCRTITRKFCSLISIERGWRRDVRCKASFSFNVCVYRSTWRIIGCVARRTLQLVWPRAILLLIPHRRSDVSSTGFSASVTSAIPFVHKAPTVDPLTIRLCSVKQTRIDRLQHRQFLFLSLFIEAHSREIWRFFHYSVTIAFTIQQFASGERFSQRTSFDRHDVFFLWIPRCTRQKLILRRVVFRVYRKNEYNN